MEVVNLIQGSQEWLDFRKNHYPASEAPAMMDVSSYEPKKSADLALVRLGLKTIDISDYEQKIFDEGHFTEACARPIVEKIIGEPLSNMTVRMDVHELAMGLSASLDGINFDGDVLFEHKMWNTELAKSVLDKNLKPHYTWQLEQQLLVSGAEKVIFVTSDSFRLPAEDLPQFKDSLAMISDEMTDEQGNKFYCAANNFAWMIYTPQKGKSQELIEGWARFEQTVAEVIVEDDQWTEIAENFLAVNNELKLVNEQKKEIEGRLKPLKAALITSAISSGTTKMVGAGIEVSQVIRKGGLDESLLLQFLTQEQIDECRKEATSSWGVKESKINPTKEQVENAKEIQKRHGNKPSLMIGAIVPNMSVSNAGAFSF